MRHIHRAPTICQAGSRQQGTRGERDRVRALWELMLQQKRQMKPDTETAAPERKKRGEGLGNNLNGEQDRCSRQCGQRRTLQGNRGETRRKQSKTQKPSKTSP